MISDYQRFIHTSRYARWNDEFQRRETWEETVSRLIDYYEYHLNCLRAEEAEDIEHDENLENINASLDTDFWSGGQMFLGGVDSDYKAAIFSGNSNISEIETDEIEPFPGLRSNVLGVRPFINAASTITVKTRERLQDTATESSSATTVTSGVNPVRESGRFVRANVKIASGVNYDHAQGVDLSLARAGVR